MHKRACKLKGSIIYYQLLVLNLYHKVLRKKGIKICLQLSSTSLLSKCGSAVYTRSRGSVSRVFDAAIGCTVTSSIPKSTIVASTKPSLGSGTQTTCSILKCEREHKSLNKLILKVQVVIAKKN